MKTLLLPALLALLLLLAVGCSEPSDAAGPASQFLSVTTDTTWTALQDSLASTKKRTSYVMALEDDLEIIAWRYLISAAGTIDETREWVQVLPNPADDFSEDVITCPSGFSVPIEGEFDALSIKGKVSGGNVAIHTY